MLSVTRHMMKCADFDQPNPYPGGRTKATNIMMSQYISGRKNISNLDRDDALGQDGKFVCAHCGVIEEKYHWDHLIPRKKLVKEYIPLNQVRSCGNCNVSRGAKDLMAWHRENSTFPTLGVLRRYLKLCYFFAERRELLDSAADFAHRVGLPFDPTRLPRKFPPMELIVWDFAFQQA